MTEHHRDDRMGLCPDCGREPLVRFTNATGYQADDQINFCCDGCRTWWPGGHGWITRNRGYVTDADVAQNAALLATYRLVRPAECGCKACERDKARRLDVLCDQLFNATGERGRR